MAAFIFLSVLNMISLEGGGRGENLKEETLFINAWYVHLNKPFSPRSCVWNSKEFFLPKARFPLGNFFRAKRLFPLSVSHFLM